MNASAFSDDYIVRIYRYNKRNARRFVGTVEEVGTKGKKAFTTIDELWGILTRTEKEGKKEKGGDVR